ncbi:hypothetical protein [Sphaerisporangium dianthi]|uniref:Mycothiol-dependent maleylpyruvate isomerase metal-binding domain-containing protein n=1 Tax=Sphaerisporangium dianthi TaxID=1436120 RepID=A0ABV9CHK0_9ACTN
MSRSAEAGPSVSPSAAPPAVTADDLDQAVHLVLGVLGGAPADAWDRKAGSLEWDCWETIQHLSDDFFSYALRLGRRTPALDHSPPLLWESRRPGGPQSAFRADRSAGPEGLLQVLEACGGLLAAVVRTRPPHVRAYHVYGASDPAGFAAMGIVEALVHTHDVAGGLGFAWNPPADLCARVLARLFPEIPATGDPWPCLLWATGRGELPGRPRLTTWRWYGAPLA